MFEIVLNENLLPAKIRKKSCFLYYVEFQTIKILHENGIRTEIENFLSVLITRDKLKLSCL